MSTPPSKWRSGSRLGDRVLEWKVKIMYLADLNKAHPKGSYPLLCINQLVDATFFHKLLRFINTCYGYNKIQMDEKDALHTSVYVYNDIYEHNDSFGAHTC